MIRYLDPKNDLTFKRIFGEHPELLIMFLNAVMPFEPDRFIKEITYLPSEMIPDNPTRKYSLVDVRCRDNSGRQFIVEMQMYWDGAKEGEAIGLEKAVINGKRAGCSIETISNITGLTTG